MEFTFYKIVQGRISEIRRPLCYLEELLSESAPSPKRGGDPASSPSLLGAPFLTQADIVWSVTIQTLLGDLIVGLIGEVVHECSKRSRAQIFLKFNI
jgi:hypothetical protein